MPIIPTRDHITVLYPRLKQVARNITGGKDSEDLLHIVLANIIERGTIFPSEKDCEFYVIRALWSEARGHNRCQFAVQYRNWRDRRTDIQADRIEPPETWLGARLDNEVMDLAVQFLHPFDREVFSMFILDGFDYGHCAKATGIPISTLYHSVERSKEKLRTIVKRHAKANRTSQPPERKV